MWSAFTFVASGLRNTAGAILHNLTYSAHKHLLPSLNKSARVPLEVHDYVIENGSMQQNKSRPSAALF